MLPHCVTIGTSDVANVGHLLDMINWCKGQEISQYEYTWELGPLSRITGFTFSFIEQTDAIMFTMRWL